MSDINIGVHATTGQKVAIGAAAGAAAALTNTTAPHFKGGMPGTANFTAAATKSLKANPKHIGAAVAAGTMAVLGNGAVGTAVVAAGPVILLGAAAVGAVGAAIWGIKKLIYD
jgi:hypothetical protein